MLDDSYDHVAIPWALKRSFWLTCSGSTTISSSPRRVTYPITSCLFTHPVSTIPGRLNRFANHAATRWFSVQERSFISPSNPPPEHLESVWELRIGPLFVLEHEVLPPWSSGLDDFAPAIKTLVGIFGIDVNLASQAPIVVIAHLPGALYECVQPIWAFMQNDCHCPIFNL